MKRKLVAAVVAIVAAATIILTVPTKADAAGGRCPRYESLMHAYGPKRGWPVQRMSYIAWRESRWIPTAVNKKGGDSGLFQIHPVTWEFLSRKFGVTVNREWLLDVVNNVRAAAVLCDYGRRVFGSCLQPWRVNNG